MSIIMLSKLIIFGFTEDKSVDYQMSDLGRELTSIKETLVMSLRG